MTIINKKHSNKKLSNTSSKYTKELKNYDSFINVKLDSIVGRLDIKEKIRILINSAKKRNDVIDHILFYGPPGLGKTTFAHAIANELGAKIIISSGATIKNKMELVSLVAQLEYGDVLFIDEIHRLARILEEFLYPVLDNFVLDITVGSGLSTKISKLKIPKFTLIGATTNIGLISNPLRDRFGSIFKLDFLDLFDLVELVKKYSVEIDLNLDDNCILEVAKRSRGTPRIAIRNLRRIRDFCIGLFNTNNCTYDILKIIFSKLDVDELGLDMQMKKYLLTLLNVFDGGPVGISNLAACIDEDIQTLENFYEPYLIRIGFVKRTNRGRIITTKGRKYISGHLS